MTQQIPLPLSNDDAFKACEEAIRTAYRDFPINNLTVAHAQFIPSRTNRVPFVAVTIELEGWKLRYGCFSSDGIVVAVGLGNHHVAYISSAYSFERMGQNCPVCKQERHTYRRIEVAISEDNVNRYRCLPCMTLPDVRSAVIAKPDPTKRSGQ